MRLPVFLERREKWVTAVVTGACFWDDPVSSIFHFLPGHNRTVRCWRVSSYVHPAKTYDSVLSAKIFACLLLCASKQRAVDSSFSPPSTSSRSMTRVFVFLTYPRSRSPTGILRSYLVLVSRLAVPDNVGATEAVYAGMLKTGRPAGVGTGAASLPFAIRFLETVVVTRCSWS